MQTFINPERLRLSMRARWLAGATAMLAAAVFAWSADRADAAVTATVQSSGGVDVLSVTGDAADDSIVVTCGAADKVFVNGAPVTPGPPPNCADIDELVVLAGRGNDTVDLRGYDPAKFTSSKQQDIFGHAGNDVVYGSLLNDTVRAGTGNDRVRGRAGKDMIIGKSGNDRLAGKAGNDEIKGNKGNDLLKGGKGSDRLFGGSGRDKLRGGADRDTIDGGSGMDNEKQ